MRNHVHNAMTWMGPILALLGLAFSGCATAPLPKESTRATVTASPAPPQSKADLSQSRTASPQSGDMSHSENASPGGTPSGAAAKQNATPLTLAECVKIALEQNPAKQAAREEVITAREKVGEATAPYYPELDLNAGYDRFRKYGYMPSGASKPGMSPIVGPTDDWTAGLSARLLLFDSGERGAHRAAVMAKHGAAQEDEETVRQDIVLQVHQAYYGLRSAQEARSIAGKSLLRAEDHLRLATEKREAGTAPKVDVIRTQAEVAQAKLSVVKSESLVRIAKGNLNVAMGSPVDTVIEVQGATAAADQSEAATSPEKIADQSETDQSEAVTSPEKIADRSETGTQPEKNADRSEAATPPEKNADQSEAATSPEKINVYDALDQAVKARPALKAALLRTAAARREVNAARSTFGPKILAEAGYDWRGPDFFPEDEEWSAGVSLNWPLFTGFSRKHKLSRTKAELSKEEAEVQRLALEVQAEVWSSYSKLQETYEAIQTSEALVQEAQESLRLARERYEAGSGPLNDLLDTQTALDKADASRLEARWDYLLARASFQRAIGTLDGREKPDGQGGQGKAGRQ
jgi:outer membrane protein TolC